MNLEQALHHAILRDLNSSDVTIPISTRNEIATSLKVEKTREGYRIYWTFQGKPKKTEYPSNFFRFYERGDKPQQDGHSGKPDFQDNKAAVTKIIRELIENPNWPPTSTSPENQKRLAPFPLILYGCLLLAFLAGQQKGMEVYLTLALLTFLEQRFYSSLPLAFLIPALLPLSGYSNTAFFGEIGCLLMGIFSPNPRGRSLLIGAAFIGIVSGLAGIVQASFSSFPQTVIPLLGLGYCIALCLFGWAWGTHTRLMPLTYPWFGLGLFLDGSFISGIILATVPLIRLVMKKP